MLVVMLVLGIRLGVEESEEVGVDEVLGVKVGLVEIDVVWELEDVADDVGTHPSIAQTISLFKLHPVPAAQSASSSVSVQRRAPWLAQACEA